MMTKTWGSTARVLVELLHLISTADCAVAAAAAPKPVTVQNERTRTKSKQARRTFIGNIAPPLHPSQKRGNGDVASLPLRGTRLTICLGSVRQKLLQLLLARSKKSGGKKMKRV